MLAKKATQFASSSQYMLDRLHRVCSKDHAHQPLVSGRAAAAAFYPKELISAILRGMRVTADAEAQEPKTDESEPRVTCATLQAQHVPSSHTQATATAIKAKELEAKMSSVKIPFRFADGRKVELEPQWKARYLDEYTNDELPLPFTQEAMADELR